MPNILAPCSAARPLFLSACATHVLGVETIAYQRLRSWCCCLHNQTFSFDCKFVGLFSNKLHNFDSWALLFVHVWCEGVCVKYVCSADVRRVLLLNLYLSLHHAQGLEAVVTTQQKCTSAQRGTFLGICVVLLFLATCPQYLCSLSEPMTSHVLNHACRRNTSHDQISCVECACGHAAQRFFNSMKPTLPPKN